jgi:hypothetical protein
MSNVVKLASVNGAKKEKKDPAVKWKKNLTEQGEKLMDRLYDQIRLTDEDAMDKNIPEELSDCSTLAVLTQLAVFFSSSRGVLGPSALIKLMEYQIDLEKKELRKELEEEEKE